MPRQSQHISSHFSEFEKILANAIGERIRQRRRKLKLTQENLRVKMELENVYVTRSHLSRIENGESLPVASEIIALCTVLNVSFRWLLLGEETK